MQVTVTVYPREDGRPIPLSFATGDAWTREHFGTTLEEITRSVAAAYCDSGSVIGTAGAQRYVVARA